MRQAVDVQADDEANERGLVVAGFRRHFDVRLADGRVVSCLVRGRNASVACGDEVSVLLGSDREGVIVSVAPRDNLFFRSDAHREKLLAANVSQLVAVIAPDPPFDDELVNRWIVSAESNGCRTIIV